MAISKPISLYMADSSSPSKAYIEIFMQNKTIGNTNGKLSTAINAPLSVVLAAKADTNVSAPERLTDPNTTKRV